MNVTEFALKYNTSINLRYLPEENSWVCKLKNIVYANGRGVVGIGDTPQDALDHFMREALQKNIHKKETDTKFVEIDIKEMVGVKD